MKSTREIIESNLAWIITVLVSIGFFVATFKYQGDAISRAEAQNVSNLESINKIEKTALADLNRQLAETKVKLDRMEKSDVQADKNNVQMSKMSAQISSLQDAVTDIKIDLREVKNDIKGLISKRVTLANEDDMFMAGN